MQPRFSCRKITKHKGDPSDCPFFFLAVSGKTARLCLIARVPYASEWLHRVPFLEKLAPNWPTLTILHDYSEMGLGYKGMTKAAGDFIEDHCLEF